MPLRIQERDDLDVRVNGKSPVRWQAGPLNVIALLAFLCVLLDVNCDRVTEGEVTSSDPLQ